jgi:prevent-host-death family protein
MRAVDFALKLAYNNYSEIFQEAYTMPNIKPVSDLRNYTEVLKDIESGNPVFLTKNGRGRYVIVDMEDYEKTQAAIKLITELAKGKRAGEEQGWLSVEDVERDLGIHA